MVKILTIYVCLMLFLTFLFHYERKPGLKLRDVRLDQIRRLVSESAAAKSFGKNLRSRIKPSKRRRVEKLIKQAGLQMTFEEYVIASALSSIVLSLIFGVTLSNVLLGMVFAVMGFFIPHQIITFFRNKRLLLLENQIGSFMTMSISRYKNMQDFNKVLRLVEREFEGEEPIHSEIMETIREIDASLSVKEAVHNMAERTDNKYMKRFASYYAIASEVGTKEVRHDLLNQAYLQYQEDYKLRRELKREIAGPKQEAYIMIGAVPAFALYQVLTSDGYVEFMTGSGMGRIGTTVIISTLVLVVWFVNAKLGAPLD